MKDGKKSNRFSLRNIIISITIVMLFVGVLIGYYSMLYKETREKIIKKQELSAVTEAEQIDKYLSTGIYTMRFTCFTLDNMIRNGQSMTEIEDFLRSQSEAVVNIMSGYSNGIYGYINGKYLDGSGLKPEDEEEITTRPWFVNARANIGRVAIIDPYFDMKSQTMTISLSKTLCDAESVAGMDFSLEYMQQLTETLSSESDSDMDFVLDQDYTVITHSDRSEIGKQYLNETDTFGAALADILRSTDESYFSLKYEGGEYIVYRVPVANDWICVSVFDATSIFRQMKWTLVFTIFAVCFVVVTVFLILRFIRKKTQIEHQLETDIQQKDDQIKKITMDTYRDPLTGVRNKAAQQKLEEQITEKIINGSVEPFSIVMIDLNNLKYVNDTYGHDMGNEYLKNSCMLFCNIYKHSPVFRIGGDEFIAVLQQSDFENRTVLRAELEAAFEKSISQKDVDPWKRCSAAIGTADYYENDSSFDEVFKRADQAMYVNKNEYKAKHGSYR